MTTESPAVSGDGTHVPDPRIFVDSIRTEELLAWAETNAFAPATVLLTARLAGSEYLDPRTRGEGAAEFVQGVVAALPAQQGKGSAPRDWLFRLYDGVPTSIRSRLVEDGDVRAADAVIAMHKSVAAGATIDAKAWREARKRFVATISPSAPAAVVQAILASMWDLDSSPGAIADVAESWISETSLVDAIVEAGWSQPEYVSYAAIWDVFSSRYVPREPEPNEAQEAFETRRNEILSEPNPISEQQWAMATAFYQARPPIILRRRAELRQLLLEVIAD
jgi:hypothetical protein